VTVLQAAAGPAATRPIAVRRQETGLVGVSYDTAAILKEFSTRRGITYPLIADPQSEIINRFGVLNASGTDFMKGMAIPGFVYVSVNGQAQQTCFEENYGERDTANNVIARLFPELAESGVRVLAAPHVQLRLSQSDLVVGPGNRLTLTVQLRLPKDLHVYAPGVQGYKPIVLQLDANPEVKLAAVQYPRSEVLFLPAIHERVPVFSGAFRITEDVTVASNPDFTRALRSAANSAGKTTAVTGTLFYQACDAVKCFLPDKMTVSWQFRAVPLDLKLSPETIRHPGDP
jgi:hypothetical protein